MVIGAVEKDVCDRIVSSSESVVPLSRSRPVPSSDTVGFARSDAAGGDAA